MSIEAQPPPAAAADQRSGPIATEEQPAPTASQPGIAPATPRRSLGRATALLSVATLFSRILGLVREQAFAALLGAGLYGDAFTMGFRLPNLLRDLFAEGALSAAFQPAFAQRLQQQGQEQAYGLANLVLTTLLLIVGVIVGLGLLFAPQMVAGWAAGYASVPGKAELTVTLTRVMMPFLLLVSLAAVLMGVLNAEERFFWPAMSPSMFNLAAIVGGVLLWAAGVHAGRTAALGWAIATLAGGALQLAVQWIALDRSGYRYRPRVDLRFRDSGLRQVMVTMAPATIGLMATQVNIYVSSSFASTENGAVTWLNVAFRLMQLPIGMFGVAVGTVALSRYSRSLGAGQSQAAIDEVSAMLGRGLRLVVFLSLPTAVALWVLAEPTIAVIYQHGAFRASDTLASAAALRLYAIGLLAYAAIKVAAPVFYTLGRPRIPVLATVAAVGANVVLNLGLHPRYGFRVLALGTSLAALCNLAILLISYQRRCGGAWHNRLPGALSRVALATAAMGASLWGADHAFNRWLAPPAPGTLGRLIGLGLALAIGGAVYLVSCTLLGLDEVGTLRASLRRKLGSKRGR